MSSQFDPDPELESLKERAWRDVAAIDRVLLEGRIDEEGWHAAMAALIKPAYLAANDKYVQAGHTGDENTWEASRGLSQRRYIVMARSSMRVVQTAS